MSNAIRYDSLLVRELARELRERLRGARLEAAFLDRERLRVTLQTRAPRRDETPPPSLLWQLHPGSGHLTPAPTGAGSGKVPLRSPRIADVSAPPDERIIVMDLDAGADAAAGAPVRIIIELITNQWNALAVAADDRIVAVLRERQTKARTLRAGVIYEFPPLSTRAGATAALPPGEWIALLEAVPPAERLLALPRLIAFTSPTNAPWIIGDAGVRGDADALERAYERYVAFIWDERPRPVLLQEGDTWQPYVAPHAAAVSPDAGPDAPPSLLAAFALAAERADISPATAADTEDALGVVAQRIEAVDKRLRRLREEQNGAAAEAQRLRMQADVLISNLHLVPRGAAEIELPGFDGDPLHIELDPAMGPADNAKRLYDSARRRDRAAARMPAMIGAAEAELSRLEELAGRVRDGTATSEELERVRKARRTTATDAQPALPYRNYRTTGGLEVRVGRGSRANDETTFRHSSPNDIWLHARDVAGAHVILRWGRPDANPPARDIVEAAVLAALYSKARSSGTVPVDWTRRKHVRKPRKAGPGLVIPERVKTVFVEPDPAVEERLRMDAELA